MKQTPAKRDNINFGKLAATTIAAVYLLILVGSIVRTTGSGMGCPDWPTCFGSYVPPTSAEQLPENYQEIYLEKRLAKNERFANLLSAFGAHRLADAIQHEKIVGEETEFNPVKTWIEYVNRLVGVTIGALILLTALYSLRFRKRIPQITWLSLLTLVTVIFQGWLGSVVVSTNLLPWLITVHMLPALLLVALLISVRMKALHSVVEVPSTARLNGAYGLLIVLLALSLVQVIIGTQVREQIDEIALAHANQNRELWIDELGLMFYVHRSYSILLVLLHLALSWMFVKQLGKAHKLSRWSLYLLAVVMLEVITGIWMAYFAIPAFLQPVHLLFGTALFGIQFYLLMLSKRSIVLPQTQPLTFQKC